MGKWFKSIGNFNHTVYLLKDFFVDSEIDYTPSCNSTKPQTIHFNKSLFLVPFSLLQAVVFYMSIFGAAFSLFLVYNVLGNVPFYIAILKPFSARRQKFILFREMVIALFILLSFGFFGHNILTFIGITGHIISIAGGILLLLISLTMIFPKHTVEGLPEHEPMIVPIATPAMAGPGSIAAVMLYAQQIQVPWKIIAVIFFAWLPSLAIIMAASLIRDIVGEKGLIAFERFGGLLISLIAVQMITSGTITLIKDNFDVASKPQTTHVGRPH